jgi:hypothetical protein
MQPARQPAPRTAPAPRKRRLRAAEAQDGPGPASPARELQDALHNAYAEPTPEPFVPAWPGWAKLTVLAAGAALSWAGLVGAVRALL